MGVTNFDNLPQNLPTTILREAQQASRELKGSRQIVSGANLRYFTQDNAGTFAWSGQLTTQNLQGVSQGLARFIVTLTTETAPVFLSRAIAELFSSADSGATWTQVNLIGSPFALPPLKIVPLENIIVEPYTSKWQVYIDGPYLAYYAFKIQALTTAPVTISVEQKL